MKIDTCAFAMASPHAIINIHILQANALSNVTKLFLQIVTLSVDKNLYEIFNNIAVIAMVATITNAATSMRIGISNKESSNNGVVSTYAINHGHIVAIENAIL